MKTFDDYLSEAAAPVWKRIDRERHARLDQRLEIKGGGQKRRVQGGRHGNKESDYKTWVQKNRSKWIGFKPPSEEDYIWLFDIKKEDGPLLTHYDELDVTHHADGGITVHGYINISETGGKYTNHPTTPFNLNEKIWYKQIVEIDDLSIGDGIVNVDFLKRLKKINKDLRISGKQLEDISGLDNVEYIGGDLDMKFGGIKKISGFNKLTHIGETLEIWCDELESIEGFKNLKTIGQSKYTHESIEIMDFHQSIKKIDAFHNIEKIEGDVRLFAAGKPNPEFDKLKQQLADKIEGKITEN